MMIKSKAETFGSTKDCVANKLVFKELLDTSDMGKLGEPFDVLITNYGPKEVTKWAYSEMVCEATPTEK
jgi:hypothetical protein